MKIIKTRYLVNPEGMVVEEIQEVDELELKTIETLEQVEKQNDSTDEPLLLSFQQPVLIQEYSKISCVSHADL